MKKIIVQSSDNVKIVTIPVSRPRIPTDILAKAVNEWFNRFGNDGFDMVSEATVHFKATDGKITISVQR